MFKYDGKEYRNLQEQVEKNKNDILYILTEEGTLNKFGLKVVEEVTSIDDLPSTNSEEFAALEYGDTYAVGTIPPYNLYIKTRANGTHPSDYWFPLGQFPLPGPQGPQGETGPQGPQGPQGIAGPTAGVNKIFGIVPTTANLPNPVTLNDLSAAYLVGSSSPYDLYTQVGATPATAVWTNMGVYTGGSGLWEVDGTTAVLTEGLTKVQANNVEVLTELDAYDVKVGNSVIMADSSKKIGNANFSMAFELNAINVFSGSTNTYYLGTNGILPLVTGKNLGSSSVTWSYTYTTNISDGTHTKAVADLVTKDMLLSLVYPVGSIYTSVNNVSPATFLGGTWVQLKDRFLLGAGDTYSNGATGGSAQLVANITLHASGDIFTEEVNGQGYTATYKVVANSGGSATISENVGAKVVGTTDDSNSLPPYLVVYMWKRTA